jgi:hypothetical protein
MIVFPLRRSLGLSAATGALESPDVADVCPQPSVPHPLDDLTQLGTIGFDDEVDSQAVLRLRLGTPGDAHQRSAGPDQSRGPLLDVAADHVEDQIDSAESSSCRCRGRQTRASRSRAPSDGRDRYIHRQGSDAMPVREADHPLAHRQPRRAIAARPTRPAATPAVEPGCRRDSWSVGAIALGAFVIVMTETLPVGLLPQIADGPHVSLGLAGLIVLVPGFSAAVSAPLFFLFSGRFNRRSVILVLGLTVLVSNAVVAVAPKFVLVLIVTRAPKELSPRG